MDEEFLFKDLFASNLKSFFSLVMKSCLETRFWIFEHLHKEMENVF